MNPETPRQRIARQLRGDGVLVSTDSRGRLTIPNGEPYQRYAVEELADGTLLLRPLNEDPPWPSGTKTVDVRDPEGRL